MKKWLCGIVSVLLFMAVLMIPQKALASGCNHDTWTAWNEETSLPSIAGSYYLTKDVNISSTWEVSNDINLCLNGHNITLTGTSGCVIKVMSYKTLNLYDCQGKGKITGGKGDAHNYIVEGGGVYVDDLAIFNMYGGIITGNKVTEDHGSGGGVCIASGGAFDMFGGSIIDNESAWDGGGVYSGGPFHMYGGTISGNRAGSIGGGLYTNSSNVLLVGGEITNNSAGTCGGGVYGNINCTNPLKIGGSLNITGNTADLFNGENNLHIPGESCRIAFDEVSYFPEGMKVGITLQGTTYATSTTGWITTNGGSYGQYIIPDNENYWPSVSGGFLELKTKESGYHRVEIVPSQNGGAGIYEPGSDVPYGYAKEGNLVGIAVEANSGYVLKKIQVNDGQIPINKDTDPNRSLVHWFTMPAGDAKVTSRFISTDHIHTIAKIDGQAPTYDAPGWKDYYKCSDDDCGDLFEESTGATPITDIDAWKSVNGRGYLDKLKYTITFDANGGSPAPSSQKLYKGEKAIAPTNSPSKEGYNFKGWSADGVNKFDFSNTSVTSDLTLKAIWEEKPHVHDMTKFDGKPATEDNAGYKDYYQCKDCHGYFEDASGTKPIDNIETWKSVGGDGYIEKLTPSGYKVSFDANGGLYAPNSQTVKKGDKASKPNINPIREGFTFKCWLYNDEEFSFDTSIQSDITLIASWEKNNDPSPTPQPTPGGGGNSGYSIVEGNNSTWIKNSKNGLLVVSNAEFSKFKGVKFDGVTLDSKNYNGEAGSTRITILPLYLNNMSNGKHTVEIVSEDGSALANITIVEGDSTTPKTGDNGHMVLWIVLFVISLGALAGTLIYFNKNKEESK